MIEISQASFSDVDHMVEWSRALGWDNVGTQLTTGENRIFLDGFALPDLFVGHYSVQQSIHNVFALPDGMVLFEICRAKLPLVWCGRHLPPTMLGIARSGIEHDVALHAGWDCYEFMITEDVIHRTEIFPSDFFARATQFEHTFLPLTEPVTGQFLKQLDAFFRIGEGANGRSVAGTAVNGDQLFDYTTRGLLQVVDAGLEALGSHELRPVRRPDIVRNAKDFVMAHLTADLSADDIARTLGVSYRSLNYAFKDALGISPYQYIQTQKLHAVRRLLKTSDITVTEACLAHGFYTPGRFTRQYSKLFGELPSATRARSRSA